MTAIAPERSVQQRLDAIEMANKVRFYRAQVKRDMKAGSLLFIDVLYSEDERLATMKVVDLLLAVRWLGREKAERIMRRAGIAPSKSVGGMTERQVNALVSVLADAPSRVRFNTLGY